MRQTDREDEFHHDGYKRELERLARCTHQRRKQQNSHRDWIVEAYAAKANMGYDLANLHTVIPYKGTDEEEEFWNKYETRAALMRANEATDIDDLTPLPSPAHDDINYRLCCSIKSPSKTPNH